MTAPADYNLPHPDWRLYQRESLDWLKEQNGMAFLEAPTGSGKSAVAAGLAHSRVVTSLCRTKALQDDTYGGIYGFDVLKGRGNYPCSWAGGTTQGDQCAFAPAMHECPDARECEYLLQKAVAQGSSRVSLNYPYWLTAGWPRREPPDALVLDEGDELPDLVVDWASATVTVKDRQKWGLPGFPRISSKAQLQGEAEPVLVAIDWLTEARSILVREFRRLRDEGETDAVRKRALEAEHFGRKLRACIDALQSCLDDWFIRSGPSAREVGGRRLPGFVARPLTARHHFRGLFDVSPLTLIMSATIGAPETLARELGIEDWVSRVVPNQWPAETRSIYVPEDVPKIGRAAEEKDYLRQAELAAGTIKHCPPDWFGIILVTRKTEATLVADRLARLGLQDRIWVPPSGRGSDEMLRLWQERKARVPGSIVVHWDMWRGYDGLDEKILLVFKTPYPSLGSEYERERMRFDGKMYLWRTANRLAQGLGRTRRGRPEDYDVDGCNGVVGIFDRNWRRVRKYLPEDVLEAVVH